MRRSLTALAAALVLAAPLGAGKYNEVLNLGDPAPVWKDLPGTDDQKHGLADLKDRPVVVVVFTCNSCPCAVDYEDRILAFAKKYSGRVGVVAINVNTIAEDQLPRMKEKAKARDFPFAYLYDETQQIARAYGATYTPEFFVLDKDRKIAYMGAMDDKDKADQVKRHWLEEAVEATLKGARPEIGETAGRGCLIRYNKKRR